MLDIVVRGGEGGDVRQGVTADRGVGALAPSHALNIPWFSCFTLQPVWSPLIGPDLSDTLLSLVGTPYYAGCYGICGPFPSRKESMRGL